MRVKNFWSLLWGKFSHFFFYFFTISSLVFHKPVLQCFFFNQGQHDSIIFKSGKFLGHNKHIKSCKLKISIWYLELCKTILSSWIDIDNKPAIIYFLLHSKVNRISNSFSIIIQYRYQSIPPLLSCIYIFFVNFH